MLFDVQGAGIDVSEPSLQDALETAFAPVSQRFGRAVIKLSVTLAVRHDVAPSAKYRCTAKIDLFGWPSFQIEADGDDAQAAVDCTAQQLIEALASILEGA